MRRRKHRIRKPRSISQHALCRLGLQESASIRRCLERQLGRLSALEFDVSDFGDFSGGPTGTVEIARRGLFRRLDEIEAAIAGRRRS